MIKSVTVRHYNKQNYHKPTNEKHIYIFLEFSEHNIIHISFLGPAQWRVRWNRERGHDGPRVDDEPARRREGKHPG